MQPSIVPCSPWQRRPCSCAGLTRARFSRQLRSPVRLIVWLDSGRLDALYPYCVEAGGATHLDALMVMLVLWQPSCWLIMSRLAVRRAGVFLTPAQVLERWLQQNKIQGFLLHMHEGLQDHLKSVLDSILDR
jgi:hypothetical protein